jgi:nucleotide-binding universal stress UspA family protein
MSTDPFETAEVTHVLFGTDGSETAHRAQRWAMGIARFWGAKMTVVCAFDSPRSFRKRGSLILPEVRDEMEAEAREIAAEAASELKENGVDAEAVAFEGSAVDAILYFAEERHSNVVVIGGGGREGARDYLVGSTVERIVRHSPVPVLVIK